VRRRRHRLFPALSIVLLALAVCAGACTSAAPAATHQPASSAAPAAQRGTPGWQITHPGPNHAIEGFADHASVLPGQPVTLFVSTTAPSFTVTAYRFGAYRGSAALQVWQSGPRPGVPQPAFVLQRPTNTVVAPWQPSLTVTTGGWQPGDYLFRLDGSNGAQQFVPLTVRTPDNAGRIVIVNAVTTWQAYNRWGGYSLYDSEGGKYAQRSHAVSFDRPYQADTMQGAGDFLYFELPFVLFAERTGLQLGYATDVDLDADAHLLDGARAMITLGHDEYWSGAMRNAATRARDAGVNLAFLGGNEIYRHIRFDSTPLGPDRLEIDYKSFDQDPYHVTNPLDATPEWRSPPFPRPESVLLGNFYQCNPVQGDLVVADPGNWLLSGIAAAGQRFPGLIGNEYEGVDLSVPTPRPIEVLFHSPVVCQGRPGFSDATYYTTPGGAAVFSAGTQYWICGLDSGCDKATANDGAAFREISAITERLLRAYAAGPASRAHPAVDNLSALHIAGATPNPAPTLPPAIVATR
jgi:N,N-dimethylformamidase beta subunit-like protein